MPLPKNRSTKYRKMKRKTSKGTKRIFLKRKNKGGVACAVCKETLAGIRPGSRTEKSVSRKFGGHLCHSCSEYVIKEASRIREKMKTIEDVELPYKRYIEQLAKQ